MSFLILQLLWLYFLWIVVGFVVDMVCLLLGSKK